MVIIDTNIIIDHLRQSPKEKSQLVKIAEAKSRKDLALSVISVQELFEGRSTREKQKEQLLLAAISPLRILPYTYKIAKLAGKIARDLKRPIELADAAIGATTLKNNGKLLTLNAKDFRDIPQLNLVKL